MTTNYEVPNQIKPRVLIVDDETEICQTLAISLNKTKFQINYAENAAVAYKLLEEEPYDVIVTDVMMPGEDGIAFLGRVHKTWPEIPVIIMTGYAQLQMAVNAIKNGAFDFVHKPFDFDLMRTIVERAVNYTRLQRMEKNYRAELEEAVTRRTAELRDAMIELDSVRSALLKSATEKNEFIAVISHEMRTPMNGVVGGLSLLEEEVTTVDGKEYLEIVRVSADNMVVLIDALLAFGKGVGAQSGNAASSVTIDLAAELEELVTAYQAAYDRKKISLSLSIAPDVPHEIVTCKESLQRLIGILLDNALKFTEYGSVSLDVSHEDHDGTNARLIFSVADSGIGIPEAMLERIFEPFIQVDSSSTRKYGGVGLGLAIAQQNALMLNGKMWAEQVSDGGSRFVFTMKVATAEAMR